MDEAHHKAGVTSDFRGYLVRVVTADIKPFYVRMGFVYCTFVVGGVGQC